MDIYEDFLEMLDAAIARSGNAKRLAELLGVHPALLTRWKRKDRRPSLHHIQPIVDYLGVTWTWPGRTEAARPEEPCGAPIAPDARAMGKELDKLKKDLEVARAQLEAEREKTALLERLLTTALSAGRGAAAEPPAAPDQLKRKAG